MHREISSIMWVEKSPVEVLSCIVKSCRFFRETPSVCIDNIFASGGGFFCNLERNSLIWNASPSTHIRTPSGLFCTLPARERDFASFQINGRKPTPWTIPSTLTIIASRL
jgi:hypothetical protein